jgi:hypothetical protein
MTLGKGKMSEEEKVISAKGQHLQGNKLVEAKMKNKK